MLTIIIRRTDEPTVIQMTQEAIVKELRPINGSEMLLEDHWIDGLKKVRTPYVCLVEADCVLSANYLASNFGLMKKLSMTPKNKGGGFTKLAMIASCLGIKTFDNRVYDYQLKKVTDKGRQLSMTDWGIGPTRDKPSSKLYSAQVGFVPGAILRYASVKDVIDTIDWEADLIGLSTELSFHLWNTDRRIQVNPNTTYVSNEKRLDKPVRGHRVPDRVGNIFHQEGIGLGL